jgi:hypothetical protein
MQIAEYVERCLQQLTDGMERCQAAMARAPYAPAIRGFQAAEASAAASSAGFSIEVDVRFDVEFVTRQSGPNLVDTTTDILVRPGAHPEMLALRVPVYIRSAAELVRLVDLDLGQELGEVLAPIRSGLQAVADRDDAPGEAVTQAQFIKSDLEKAKRKLEELLTLRALGASPN